jgi:hypothetical protein
MGARQLGLTPTQGVVTIRICSDCSLGIEALGGRIVDPHTYGF